MTPRRPNPENREELQKRKDEAIKALIEEAKETDRIKDLEDFIADISFWIEEPEFKEHYKETARFYVVDELLGRQLIDFINDPEMFQRSGYKFDVKFTTIEDQLKQDLRETLEIEGNGRPGNNDQG